jgi:hypothetical protein
MFSARQGGARSEDAKAELARLSEGLRAIAEGLRRLPLEPDRHIEETQRLRRELEEIRNRLIAIDRKLGR